MGLESIAYAVDRIAWCAINPSPCAGSDLIHLSISHLSGLEFTRQCYAGASSDADALTTLQGLYLNPDEPAGNRIKAAAAAIGYERPKLTATGLVVVDFRERVRQARLKATAKLIEHTAG